MKLLLVGGKQLLNSLIKSLQAKGYDITVIHKDKDICRMLADTYEVISIPGDGTNPSILKEANVKNMDFVIALSDNDAENLVVCELVKNKFSAKKTCALVNDPKNALLFKELGIDKCVSTSQILVNLIDQEFLSETLENYLPSENGSVLTYELGLDDTSPVINKKLWEINFPKGSIIVCILRMDQAIVPQGNTELKSGDRIIVISSAEAKEKTVQILSGKDLTRNS